MKNFTISAPEKLANCTIKLPSSKSISNRVLIVNALSYSPYEVQNISPSDDTKVMLEVLNSDGNKFDIGAAGTSMRFLTAFLSKVVGEWTITGSERMKQRPIKVLVDALIELGAKIEYPEVEGYPPLKILGSNLEGKKLTLPGNISSQYISALLMIGPTITNGLEIELTGEIISKPYIHLTLKIMREFGAQCEMKGNLITIKESAYKPIQYSVESDWSAASYWYQILALSNNWTDKVTLLGLQSESGQGDSKVADLFKQFNIKTTFNKQGVTLEKHDFSFKKSLPAGAPKEQKKMEYNFIDQPDLAQTFVVTCCFSNTHFEFTGLQSLKIKETDRITALITELAKFGYKISTNNIDSMSWNGEMVEKHEKIKTEKISVATYKDHRMAMAFAPACQVVGKFKIEDIEVVAKSYPAYWEDLKMAGFVIK